MQVIAKANQESQSLAKQISELDATLTEREMKMQDYKTEIQRLRMSLSDMQVKLDEVKHIRNDETLLKENLCLQQQIEENREQIEELRTSNIQKDESILHYMQEIEALKHKAQADLNFAYRALGFRMEKIKSMIANFQDMTAEIDKTIHNKLELIARGND